MDTKKCSKCGEVKLLTAFYKRGGCKACLAVEQKQYRAATNSDSRRQLRRQASSRYKRENRDRVLAAQRARNAEHVAKISNRYVAAILREAGVPLEQQTIDLISMKRAQIALLRLGKEIKTHLKGTK
jgi:hypothetical protein